MIRDTWNTAILPELAPENGDVVELAPENGDVVLYKHRYSGFFETDLDAILKRAGVKTLIFTGCTTSICVESTVRDAMFRDYACVLLADCMGEPIGQGLSRSNYEASLFAIQTLFGWISGADEFIKAIWPAPVAVTGA